MAAGRHPLAGIAAAFAGVSGGFSANFIPSALDPMLSGITQAAGQVLDPALAVNPLNNWFFTLASSAVVIAVGWFVTDRIVEPRLAATPVDGELAGDAPQGALEPRERRALRWALLASAVGIVLLVVSAWPGTSVWRGASGALTSVDAPLMKSIVPLIFLLFLLPGVVYGYVVRELQDPPRRGRGHVQVDERHGLLPGHGVLRGAVHRRLRAIERRRAAGAEGRGVAAGAPACRSAPRVVGIILLTAFVNLLVGSASAKWALLAPIFVPMLMQLGVSPDLTQAAYRVGDSTTNIITPLMPYFPLVVVFCRRYVTRHRHRHGGGADDSVLRAAAGELERFPAGLLGVGAAAWHPVELRLSLSGERTEKLSLTGFRARLYCAPPDRRGPRKGWSETALRHRQRC